MMKYIVQLFLALTIFVANGQDYHKMDSLINLFKTTQNNNTNDYNELKISLCIEVGDLYETSNPDSAIFWYLQNADTSFALTDVTEKKSWYQLNAKALRYAAYALKNKNELSKSLHFYYKALEIYKILGNKEDEANCCVNISEIMKKQGDMEGAVNNYLLAVRLVKELNNLQKASDYLGNIGVMLYNAGRYNEAIAYFESALDLSVKNNEKTKKLF